MEGKADDFIIGEDGELEPVAEDWTPAMTTQKVTAVVLLTQNEAGELTMQVFGAPNPSLMQMLASVIRQAAMELPQH